MRIYVKVKPASGRQHVERKNDHYLVHLKKPAKEGKANIELLKALKKYFKSNVRLVSGATSSKKIVEVD